MPIRRLCHPKSLRLLSLAALLALAGCTSKTTTTSPAARPADVKARLMTLIPANAGDRQGWATDITAAFAAQGIEPSDENLCSVLAVTEQESTFQANPQVPGCRRSPGKRSTAAPIRCTSRTFWCIPR